MKFKLNFKRKVLKPAPKNAWPAGWLVLTAIVLLAAFLRLWGLATYPAGLNADEAALGYNAYSLLSTGKDEFGSPWPIHFTSFGDYKPGLYVYLSMPFIRILGLNVWGVRLPSAILGAASVFLIYFLVKKLLKEERVGLIAAFFLAISPWHFHFSRGGWETNLATFLILSGVYSFIRGLENSKFFLFSILFFILSLYSYHSARIVVPLLGLGLLFFYKDQVFRKENFNYLVFSGVIGLIFLIPLAISFFGPAGVSRFSGVGLFADVGPIWRVNELRGDHGITTATLVRIFHNKVLAYSANFLANWAKHFDGQFLFITGDVIERNRVPDTGLMHLFEIPVVILGLYWTLTRKPEGWRFILFWLAVAPAAAAFTFQSPHALRANNMIIPLTVISAAGFYQLVIYLKKLPRLLPVTCCLLLVAVILWSVGLWAHQYFVHYPRSLPAAWEYGFDQVVSFVKENENRYQGVYVTESYDQPYILFLFYLQYPPAVFQKEAKLTARDRFGFSTVADFGKFHFRPIEWEKMEGANNILVIGTDEEIPESATIVKNIYFRNGTIAFQIAEK